MQPSDLDLIEEPPQFTGTLDELSFNEMLKIKPDIAFLLKRISIEEEARKWMVEHIILMNNAIVRNQDVLKSLVTIGENLQHSQRDDRRELADCREVSDDNASFIKDWKMKYTFPTKLLGGLIGVIVVAIATAIALKYIK